MIEKDIKGISKAHKSLNKSLKVISDWQVKHEKEDNARQEEVMSIIKSLPNKENIIETIETSIKETVNGKIDKLNKASEIKLEKMTSIEKHLNQQDTLQLQMQVTLQALTDKIDPVDGARKWFLIAVRGILYLGGLCAALIGIIKFLQTIHMIK